MSEQVTSADDWRRQEASMRRVRWAGAALVVVQFWLYHPPPGMSLPFPRWGVGLPLAAALVLVNLVGPPLERRLSARAAQRLGLATWLLDAAVVLGVTWLFAFDSTSALWALLVVPVLEGALRGRLAGALVTWGLLGAGYALRDAWAAQAYPHLAFLPESVVYRLGILLLVALTAGMLARNLQGQIHAHAEARQVAQRRAELLAVLAASGRSASGTVEQILDGIADAALRLGFDAAEVCVLDEQRETYRAHCTRGLPPRYGVAPLPAERGVAGQVLRRRQTVVVPDYADWSEGLPEIREAGFHKVVASPIFAGGIIEGVLTVGLLRDDPVTPDEIDAVELLAGHAGAALEQQRRLTERARYEGRLAHQAFHDQLTGLANRALLMERLQEALDAHRDEPDSVAVIFLDLDRFKTVNDSLGHEAGDRLLEQVAGRLRAHLRGGDLVARLGGDEFVVLMTGHDLRIRAQHLATRLAENLRQPLRLEGRDWTVSASLGVALGPEAGENAVDLLRKADVAMYAAKERGRDQQVLYRPALGARSVARFDVEAGLRAAIEHGELTCVYQPVMRLGWQRMTAVEALLRWRRPDGTLAGPAEFLPTAEESGLIVPIGRWVLEEVLAQQRRWREAHGGAPDVLVNVSTRQLRHAGFVDEVAQALAAHGSDPSRVVLEITENGVGIGDEDLVVLYRVRDLGVRLALDDFGTGWSSLERLRRLPVDGLKIDQSFVRRLPADSRSAAIVRNVTALAHELHMTVTAEGVEHAAQLGAVARLGCDEVQGYHLGMPGGSEAIDGLLAGQGGALLNG